MEKRNDIPNKNVPLRPGGHHGGPGARFANPIEKPKSGFKSFIRLAKYVSSSKGYLITLIVVMVALSALSLISPIYLKNAIDTISVTKDGLAINFQTLYKWIFMLLLVYVLTVIATFIQNIVSAKLSVVTVKKMRNDLFSKIARLPISFVDRHPHGDIMSRMTNDIENISQTVSQSISSFFSSVITIIGTFIIMLYFSPILTGVSMISIVLTVLTTTFLSKYMRKYFPMQQTLIGNINSIVEETITGYQTVISYQKEEKLRENFEKQNLQLRKIGIKAQIFGGVMGPFMNVIGNIGFLLIASVGGYLAFKNVVSIGIISAFITYSKQFNRPINELANQYAQIQTAIAGAERVFDIMDIENETDLGKAPFEIEDVLGEIKFSNVNFSYLKDKPVLKDFTLDIKPGQKIALVGATGSGKTTIVNLLTRFYEIDSGKITLDGLDIRDIPKDKLRKTIAIVLQDTIIFSDTIKNNIKYGKETASEPEILNAAKVAGVDHFANINKEGYETVLTESGSNLSQGQRQLISIARAVLADPKILILDEATSNIDTRTEMNIQKSMIALMKNRTSIIIAHRLSTIRDADKIIVIDNGRIVETGNHDELLNQKGCYYRLYQDQFAGIET